MEIFTKAVNQNHFFDLMKLRFDIFVVEQKIDSDLEIDDYDKICDHYILYVDNKVIATCRIINVNDNEVKLGRFCVDKNFRSLGYGKKFLILLENELKQKNINKISLSAQMRAKDFYLKNNYLPIGEVYIDAEIEHQTMVKNLI